MTDNRSFGARASRGAFQTIIGQFARTLLQFLILALLARLLTPVDFGIYAMVMIMVGVGEVFRDFGLSSAAIQVKSLSNAARSNLFWLNSGIGLGLTVTFYLLAPLLSLAYGEPLVQDVVRVLSITFLINGVTAQHRADLSRNLRFGSLALTELTSLVIAGICAVGVALTGGAYWSLVIFSVAQIVCSAVIVILLVRWRPSRYQRTVPMRGLLSYGGTLVASQLLSYSSTNASSFTLGVVLGPASIGFYSRAYQTLMLPLGQIQSPASRVALPILSRLQDDPERYDRFLLRGQLLLLHCVTILLSLSAAQGYAIFRLFFGPQWDPAVELFQILAVGGVFSAASYAYYWVFLSRALTKSQLKYSLVSRPALLIATVSASILWGAIGAAIAFTVVNMLLFPITAWWMNRLTPIPIRGLVFNGIRALTVYGIASIASWAFTSFFLSGRPEVLILLVGALVFFAMTAVQYLVLPSYRRDISYIIEIARMLRKRPS